jgi:glutaconyl-CoA/methylmalonyl-CoA decarboxylase subunit gamma
MKMRVKINDEIYEVEIGDLKSRPIQATIEGETFEVWPEETEAVVLTGSVPLPPVPTPAPPRAAPAPTAVRGEKTVTAPIPGVILSFSVKVGDTVEAGQEVCVLEAMKMKNAIRASHAGKITAFHVSAGQTVSHGQPLFDLE